MVGLTLMMSRAAREGYFAGHHPLLTELLGRQPRSAAEQLADHVAASGASPPTA